MLVGTLTMSEVAIKDCTTSKQLSDLAYTYIPKPFRHIRAIVNNQKYLIALIYRNAYLYDYNKWHPVCEQLLKDVRITGSLSDIYTCQDLLNSCDIDVICKFLDKESKQ